MTTVIAPPRLASFGLGLLGLLLLSALQLPRAISLSFSFNFSQYTSQNPANFSIQGDADLSGGAIGLTNNGSSGPKNRIGRVTYARPVTIWDEVTGELASFTTTFSFQIDALDDQDNSTRGDGMAFFLGRYPSSIPASSDGGGRLGLFAEGPDATNATGDGRLMAVEFDTFLNMEFDTSDSHMGIDINSLVSKAYTNTSGAVFNALWTCRVSYDNWTKRVTADLQIGDTDYHVDTVADLRQHLPGVVAIGFSSVTFSPDSGSSTENFYIYSWSFNSTLDDGAPQGHDDVGGFMSQHWWEMVTGIVALAAACAGAAAGYCCRARWERRRRRAADEETPAAHVPRRFEYAELAEAASDFAQECRLGEGAYAVVYKGQLMTNPSRQVAIKKFKVERPAALRRKAFDDEISVISRVRHRNLVEFLGWCNDGSNLVLVYELVSQGSLQEHLHSGRSWLSWNTRNNIILGLARALRYLHGECSGYVLHGDIKPSNILLDSQYAAKLADFGLARLIDHGIEPSTTCNVAGTLGYVDPHFLDIKKRRSESDVYSFGIVLLEIVSGRPPAVRDEDDQSVVTPLLMWVWNLHAGRNAAILEAADESLRNDSTADDHGQMERVLRVGLWCAHPDPRHRPPIREAMRALESRDVPIPPLPMPYFMVESAFGRAFDAGSSGASDGVLSSAAGRADDNSDHMSA